MTVSAEKANTELKLSGNNTEIVYKDGSQVNKWISWFPKSTWDTKGISAFEGKSITLQITVQGTSIKAGFASGTLTNQGRVSLGGGFHNWAYYNGTTGILEIEFFKESMTHSVILLFRSRGHEPRDIRFIKIADFPTIKLYE